MPAEKTLDSRLLSALPYLSENAVVADIGTDHAYLPIELIRRGLAVRAVACDINRGPIERAVQNIDAAGLGDRIDTLLTDGLHGVEHYHPTDVLIFGMGGELIARILAEAPWIKNPKIGLILQPMSKAEVLREWLLSEGFSILGESVTHEDQYYQTMHARFGGDATPYTEVELFVGKHDLSNPPQELSGLLSRKAETLSSVIDGKRKGNINTEAEERLLGGIRRMMEELK